MPNEHVPGKLADGSYDGVGKRGGLWHYKIGARVKGGTMTDTEQAPHIPPAFSRKAGPLPVWGYGVLLVGGVGVFWYLKHKGSANGPTIGSAVLPTGGIAPSGGLPPDSGGNSGGGTTTPVATGPTLTDLMTGMSSWFGQLLTAINNIKQVTPNPIVQPTPNPIVQPTQPQPTNGGNGGTQPTVTPTTGDTPTIPQINLNNYLMDIPSGQGIPQTDLRPGLLNLVQVHDQIPVSALEGWNAWYMNSGLWREYNPGQSFTGVVALTPNGVDPNNQATWRVLQAAGQPTNLHPGRV